MKISGNVLRVELGLKHFHPPFVTMAVLDRPRTLTNNSSDGAFRHLCTEWQFEPVGQDGCRVSLDFNYQLHASMLDHTADTLFDNSSRDIINQFKLLARLICGQ